MSYNKILQLLANGMGKDEIVAFLKNSSPKIAKKISQMLIGGYGSGQILNYLSKDPEISKIKGGRPFTPEEVADVAMIQNKMHVSQTADERALNNLKKMTPYVLGAIGMAAPAMMGRQAMGEIGSALMSGLSPDSGTNPPTPGGPMNPPPNIPQSPGQIATPQIPMPGPNISQQMDQQVLQPINNAMQQASPQQVAQATPAIQQEQAQAQAQEGTDPKQYLKNKGVLEIVDNLKNTNSPEQITAVIGMNSGDKSKMFDPELLKNISSYIRSEPGNQTQPQEQPQAQLQQEMMNQISGQQPIEPQQQPIAPLNPPIQPQQPLIEPLKPQQPPIQQKAKKSNLLDDIINPPKPNIKINPNEKKEPVESKENRIITPAKIEKSSDIKKGDEVITESGKSAEVKGISGDNFLIEEDGKIKQVPMSSLRAMPEAIKKAKIIFDPSIVPEKERSAALAISLPMPDRSSIINMFHDGTFYLYKRKDGKPIDESVIKRIVEGQDIPISSGKTFMGGWNQEEGDSRGAASYRELTSMSQDPSKEEDPTKPLIVTKVVDHFVHGYITEFMSLLKEAGRHFSAKPKKPPKPKKPTSPRKARK